MKEYEDFEEANDKLRVALGDPKRIANLYFEMDNRQQADFWDSVAHEFANSSVGAAACIQNAWLAGNLSAAAIEFIKNLAEHILLIEAES
jgi:hypothetical protein